LTRTAAPRRCAVPLYLLLPLAAAIVYAAGSVFIKRALKSGVTMDQSFHLTNFVVGLIFVPLLFFERDTVDWSEVWKPLVMGVTFFAGTWLTFLGLRRGDVSLVTPIMGTKVIFVAIGLVLFTPARPSPALWLAAILTAGGILLMGVADFKHGRRLAFTVAVTLASAAVFGLCDVLVSWWGPAFGAPTFLALGSLAVAIFSFVMWLAQGRPSLRLAPGQGGWTWWGAVFIGLQAIAMGVALSYFNDPTGVNVIYASRGFWVLVIVVVLGTALGNSEHRDNGRAFLWRVLGTLILTVAIVIAVVDRARME